MYSCYVRADGQSELQYIDVAISQSKIVRLKWEQVSLAVLGPPEEVSHKEYISLSKKEFVWVVRGKRNFK